MITTYQTLNGDFLIPKDTEDEVTWLQEHGYGYNLLPAFRLLTCLVALLLVSNSIVLLPTKHSTSEIGEQALILSHQALTLPRSATKASISLAHVKAKYRWMLTGTPVTNSLYASIVRCKRARIDSPSKG